MAKVVDETMFGYPCFPKFDLEKPRYPQTEFLGRFLHYVDVIDPRTLLTSDAKLKEAVALLETYKDAKALPPGVGDKELWEAKKIKQAMIHPDTGEKVLAPFRMSGYVPFGTPMVVGILWPNPSWFQIIFWQWINQSHNACVNYANRNASKPTPMDKFVKGYLLASSTAVGIAVGLTLLIRRSHNMPKATRLLIQRFVPVPAVSTASTLNALMMRWHEREAGIEVFDSQKRSVGTSYIAAKRAVRDTAITRFCLPAPIVLLPALAMTGVEKTRLLKRNPRLAIPLNVFFCTLTFAVALPTSLAIFPQISTIARGDLEPELQAKTSEDNLFYNKGL